jgi:HK97 family phage major capsid protein
MPATSVHTDRIKELRSALETKAAQIEQISNSFKDETGNGHFVISSEQHKAYTKAIGEAEEIKSAIVVEEKAAGLHEFMNAPAGVPIAGVDTVQGGQIRMQRKSLSQQWLESPAWQEMKSTAFQRVGQITSLEASAHGFRAMETKGQGDVYTAMGGDVTLPALPTVEHVGLFERMLRPGRVRDLFPKETTSANTLWGIRQTGFTNRARPVAQRTAADGVSPATGAASDVYGMKPKSDIQIVPFTVNVSTIAHLMYAHRDTLSDVPRMRNLIDRDMVDGLKMTEDEQLLYGDGEGANIQGLVNTPGVQTYTGLATDAYSAQVRRAMTRAILAYYEPTGVVMHPNDWENLELEKDKNGGYVIAVSVALGGEKRAWRLPVVDAPAVQETQFILGAFGTAAKVFDREQVNLQVSESNRDLFERNVVTIRCEERVALLVERPEAIVVGAFTPPAS